MRSLLAPGLMLSFIPKCPGCIAAYLALTTGLGVSFTTAGYIRDALLAICITSMVYWAAKTLDSLRSHAGTRVHRADDALNGHSH